MIAGNGCWCFWLKTWFERIWCKKRNLKQRMFTVQEKSKAEQHNNLKCSVAWSRVDFSVCWLRRTKLTTLDWWVRSYRGSVASYIHTFSRTRLLSWLSEFFAMKKDTKTYKVLILLHTFTTIVAQAFCIT